MPKGKGKTPEADARIKKHQFGQPEANRSGCPYGAVNAREFYKWVLTKATTEELRAYAEDKTNPSVLRRLAQQAAQSSKIKDIMALTNQVYGLPKQETSVEVKGGSNIYISVQEIEE